jgi:hypothetical protein
MNTACFSEMVSSTGQSVRRKNPDHHNHHHHHHHNPHRRDTFKPHFHEAIISRQKCLALMDKHCTCLETSAKKSIPTVDNSQNENAFQGH